MKLSPELPLRAREGLLRHIGLDGPHLAKHGARLVSLGEREHSAATGLQQRDEVYQGELGSRRRRAEPEVRQLRLLGGLVVPLKELEVVGLISDGLSNKQIARRLCLSLYTVKNHVHNVVEKLQVENRFKAVEYARRRGWLEKLKVMGSAGDRG